ncbi:aryl-sulfate sulfotransferase [Gelidibacter japonicus]|uniref:aryl-sulfate sulfotransferase n=1 Tax=Gelidibacter japonicus TaxID=1962232 RepID=UPI00201FCD93|nr:aryl-sulfate sulfotransferase [Gelidibacter japonicus]MCL8006952.1 aryl-sulfate sulfotransferase [Gelidibacter japonicus]
MKSQDNNALKIDFDVATSDGVDAYIQYWKYLNISQKDSTIYYSPISRNSNQHRLTLVNLSLNTEYYFNVVARKQQQKKISKKYNFRTSTKVPWVPYFRNEDSLANVNFAGYLHFHSRQVPGFLFIINGDGELVSYQRNEDNFKVSKWTQNETLLGILSNDTLHFTNGKKIIEYNKFGEVLFEAETGKNGIDKSFHHEIDLDSDGNIMTLVYDEREFDLSSVGGDIKDTVKGDGILVLNHQGEKVWEWSVFDVANPLDDEKILKTKGDWLHANSLFKDRQGNYIISFRNLSQIWKINGTTGDLIWKVGGLDGDFEIPDELVFAGQHDIRFNDEGNLVLLDNGNETFRPGNKRSSNKDGLLNKNKDSYSRLMTLSLDTLAMKVSLKSEVKFPKKYFTHSQGSAEYINDNLIVFCSTNTKRLVFTDANGEVLGILPLEYSTYKAQYIKELYDTSFVNE